MFSHCLHFSLKNTNFKNNDKTCLEPDANNPTFKKAFSKPKGKSEPRLAFYYQMVLNEGKDD